MLPPDKHDKAEVKGKGGSGAKDFLIFILIVVALALGTTTAVAIWYDDGGQSHAPAWHEQIVTVEVEVTKLVPVEATREIEIPVTVVVTREVEKPVLVKTDFIVEQTVIVPVPVASTPTIKPTKIVVDLSKCEHDDLGYLRVPHSICHKGNYFQRGIWDVSFSCPTTKGDWLTYHMVQRGTANKPTMFSETMKHEHHLPIHGAIEVLSRRDPLRNDKQFRDEGWYTINGNRGECRAVAVLTFTLRVGD